MPGPALPRIWGGEAYLICGLGQRSLWPGGWVGKEGVGAGFWTQERLLVASYPGDFPRLLRRVLQGGQVLLTRPVSYL